MQNEVVKEILKEVDKHPEIMSRRDVLKYLALSPLATSINA
ncbi:MAG: sulfide:quinone oxidoreductase, partial [Sulfurimonas sp.]